MTVPLHCLRQVHSLMGVAAGLSTSNVNSIGKRNEPTFKRPKEEAVYKVVNAFLNTPSHEVNEEIYQNALKLLGTSMYAQIAITIGFYSQISLTLNNGNHGGMLPINIHPFPS